MTTPICQSCAMPMTAPELFGTESDGTPSEDYCVHCYQKGAFRIPSETLDHMIESCVPFLVRDEGMTEESARRLLQEQLPPLKRWRTR